MEMSRIWRFADLGIEIGPRTLLMGILNVTPDSFSDGGDFSSPEAARLQASTIARDGADIIDIGGESTRPCATALSVEDELTRVMPALEALKGTQLPPVSIDTYKAQTARAAIEAGAVIVNDVWGLQRDEEMA